MVQHSIQTWQEKDMLSNVLYVPLLFYFLCIILSWTHLSSLFDVFIGSPSRPNTRLIYRAFSLWPLKPSPRPLLPLFFVVPELFHVKITCEHKNWNVRRFSLYFVKPVLASGRSWHWIKLGVLCFRFPGAWARDLEDISDAYVWHVNLYMLRIVVQLYICVLRILSYCCKYSSTDVNTKFHFPRTRIRVLNSKNLLSFFSLASVNSFFSYFYCCTVAGAT